MRKHNLAFIDIETTGLNVAKHEIIEIGALITTPELKVIEEIEMKIRPERIEDADPAALKINRYDPEDWVSALSLEEALKFLSKKTNGCVMVGHNVSFDVGFLDYAYSKVGIENGVHRRKLDTISLAWAKMHQDPSIELFSLQELSKHFGIKNERSHTALSDVWATYELYKKLMEL